MTRIRYIEMPPSLVFDDKEEKLWWHINNPGKRLPRKLKKKLFGNRLSANQSVKYIYRQFAVLLACEIPDYYASTISSFGKEMLSSFEKTFGKKVYDAERSDRFLNDEPPQWKEPTK